MVKYGEGSYGEGLYGYATSTMLQIALKELADSEKPVDRKLRAYISTFDLATQGAQFSGLPTAQEALEDVVEEINKSAKESGEPRKDVQGASSIFLVLLDELRKILCGKGKTPKKFSSHTNNVLSGVAASIAAYLGVHDSAAAGVAVLVLMTLGQVTRNTFCRMTDLEVIRALKEAKK